VHSNNKRKINTNLSKRKEEEEKKRFVGVSDFFLAASLSF
jgi:hypothetical protein